MLCGLVWQVCRGRNKCHSDIFSTHWISVMFADPGFVAFWAEDVFCTHWISVMFADPGFVSCVTVVQDWF